MDMMMRSTPKGADDEYTKGVLNERFVTNGSVGNGGEVLPPPELEKQDEVERSRRVLAVEQECAKTLLNDLDFNKVVADTDSLTKALLLPGETVVAELRCVGVTGMPHVARNSSHVGKGLLVLTELNGSNRLHFAMLKKHAQYEAEEVWMEQVSGCLCCKTTTSRVFAEYEAEHEQELTLVTLPIEQNLYDVYGSLMDTAQLRVLFSGGKEAKPGGCCSCCSCCTCCSCTCCTCCADCCKKKERLGQWAKRNEWNTDLESEIHEFSTSAKNATYKFPNISEVENKEESKLRFRRAHVVRMLYRRNDKLALEPCAIWASPAEPALAVARFVAMLGALGTVVPPPPQEKMVGGMGFGSMGGGGGPGRMLGLASGATSGGGKSGGKKGGVCKTICKCCCPCCACCC